MATTDHTKKNYVAKIRLDTTVVLEIYQEADSVQLVYTRTTLKGRVLQSHKMTLVEPEAFDLKTAVNEAYEHIEEWNAMLRMAQCPKCSGRNAMHIHEYDDKYTGAVNEWWKCTHCGTSFITDSEGKHAKSVLSSSPIPSLQKETIEA